MADEVGLSFSIQRVYGKSRSGQLLMGHGMQLKDRAQGYGWISWLLHWPSALLIVGLFALGLYMRGLDYYHPWYHRAPALHKQIGILLATITLLRLCWRLFNRKPPFEAMLAPWERIVATLAHQLLYLLLFLTLATGYLIATGGGQAVSLTDMLSIPSLVRLHDSDTEELVGELHELFSFLLIGLTLLHALAACKHHWIDRNRTLLRMLWPGSTSPTAPQEREP